MTYCVSFGTLNLTKPKPKPQRSDMACVSQGDHTVLPATHTRTTPVTLQLQSVIAIWLVLTAPTYKGIARLSWPGLLVITNLDRSHTKGTEPGHGHPSQN